MHSPKQTESLWLHDYTESRVGRPKRSFMPRSLLIYTYLLSLQLETEEFLDVVFRVTHISSHTLFIFVSCPAVLYLPRARHRPPPFWTSAAFRCFSHRDTSVVVSPTIPSAEPGVIDTEIRMEKQHWDNDSKSRRFTIEALLREPCSRTEPDGGQGGRLSPVGKSPLEQTRTKTTEPQDKGLASGNCVWVGKTAEHFP